MHGSNAATSLATTGALPDRDSFSAFLRSSYFPAFDGLRAIASLAVVWFHTAAVQFSGYLQPLSNGRRGVDVFLALSGYLITFGLLRSIDSHGGFPLRSFLVRRFARVAPLYYAVFVLYLILASVASNPMEPRLLLFWQNVPSFATLTTNFFMLQQENVPGSFGFSWSVAVEAQFYLGVGLCLSFWRKNFTWLAAAVLFVFCSTVESLRLAEGLRGFFANPGAFSPCLFGGVFLAFALRNFRLHGPLRKFFSLPGLAVLGLVATFASDSLPEPFRTLGATFAPVFVVGSLAIRRGLLHRILSSRPLEILGEGSFGIYLLHMLCFHVVVRGSGLGHTHLTAIMAMALSCVAGCASRRWFELPVQAWITRRWAKTSPRLIG